MTGSQTRTGLFWGSCPLQYAAQVLAALFNQLLLEGRFPYLFYTNPAARSVYLRAGMEEICPWRVTLLEG